jgi:DNA polymerase-3 subunit alpha
VRQIGTWAKHSLDDEEDSKGSLRIKYIASLRRQKKEIPEWRDIDPEVKTALHRIGDGTTYSGYGTNAAGLIVTTAGSDTPMPMMWVASSKTMVSQYPKDTVEALGFVKLDVLGLKNLTILNICMRNLGRDVFQGLDWIPLSDAKTFRNITKGNTDGVFQLEGTATKYGCKSLRPTKVGDIVAAMALFRPAIMQSGATASYIARKHGTEKIPQRHPLIMEITKETYGIMLFQEQVIMILRQMGMGIDDLNAFLKAVKASNADISNAGLVIEGYRQEVQRLAQRVGIEDGDFTWLWRAIEEFSAYSFNKAHAVAYGLTAYRCAYLATHHPVEYYAAVLSVAAGTPKELPYLTAVRGMGIPIRKPSVNESGVSFTSKNGTIRKGLLSIKGVGEKACNEIITKRPPQGYKDLHEMCMLVNRRVVTGAKAYLEHGNVDVGVIGHLDAAGALIF